MSQQRRVQGRYAPATSETARRQLMQPVTIWEKVWVPTESAGPASSLKIMKWVRTEKVPQFTDDDGEALDAPLAPLPDEPDQSDAVIVDDDEGDVTGTPGDTPSRAESERPPEPPVPVTPAAPKRHPLAMSFLPDDEEGDTQAVKDDEEDLGAIADHHLVEDAPVFERTQTMSRVDVGDGILENGMLVEDVVTLDVGDD
ncbi:hypothetical protein EXIGLDRAFT_769987 [Exidia glandulosa HHB12029]|uniref:Uncharacterized protein n=1 Tax=Exidia glandulosa HHB12029 TaxID=1314781 RepID=A0A165H244_EXIGL|nr:hypothetical protein EXIGLDRAFT_769987 [Exidia glandulosa HHB12029]